MRAVTTPADRAAGVLLGLACGDAAGVPYEFASAPYDPRRGPEMIGGGLGPYAPGEWSDDTQMALCIARVAAAGVPIDSSEGLDAIARGFLGWVREGATDVGTQTRQVLGALRSDDGGPGLAARMTSIAAQLHQRTGRTAGNGALMRTAPVALAFVQDPERTARAARAVAELTHADPLAGDSCVLWCEAIRASVIDGTAHQPLALDLLPPERRHAWQALADGSWRDGAPAALASNGFTVMALHAALHAVEQGRAAADAASGGTEHVSGAAAGQHAETTYREGVAAAVALGDDTDTIAAIAGSLLGAWCGADAIPSEWTAVVHGWPGYDGAGLRELAVEILDGSHRQRCHQVPVPEEGDPVP
ncbi:ADP-ribosylglycohydrolase family protein [Brachybacterium vulturis]|uniref:ADP-ribosylglycohydrolase family protein n=1 Tax=Brachybacterium vulturis TaxID=2017484 RepID=UPI003734E3E9